MKLLIGEEEFCRLAEIYTIIPVAADLPADLETPVSVYYKIVGDRPGFMLESAEASKTIGRYSFIGADPFLTLTARSAYSEGVRDGEAFRLDGPPLAALQQLLDGFACPGLAGLPPFSGGAVGYLAYEAAATWERIRGLAVPPAMILGEFMFCRTIVAFDHLTHAVKLIHLAPAGGADPVAVYRQAAARLGDLADKIRRPAELSRDEGQSGGGSRPAAPAGFGRERYEAMVAAAKEFIAAGEIFQAVLSLPFCRPLSVPPFVLYRRLRQVNPSPYMFYLDFGPRQLVGASPEMLVKHRDGRVFTNPIAGTRPRGRDAAEDARLAAELLADAKEKAEHAMLVDLGRNDLGRICRPGTVAVRRYMEVENYSHVMHLVSEVAGELAPGKKPTDILAACFPAGTVSGAPKIRAMEIIDRLEGERRGPYAGAVGYFDFCGNLDTCIAIRTLIVAGGEVVAQAGAGIVADSAPAAEYREVIHKAAAMFKVLGGEEA